MNVELTDTHNDNQIPISDQLLIEARKVVCLSPVTS